MSVSCTQLFPDPGRRMMQTHSVAVGGALLTPKLPSCTGRQETISLLLSLLFLSRVRGKQLVVSKQEIVRKSLQEKLPT